ncbi:MAG: 50S ribosomal protein L13 [Cyanobacteria bacterium REEB67]|nr:50S ribosomal protein L13 [Cyanobacteria bacterium REEB67]
MKTYCPKPDEVKREWLVVDAEGKTLGRLAVEVANVLRGKHKPEFTPHVDCGDFVVVINAEKIHVSGNKETDKFYRRHSGFPGGFKEESLAHLRARKPIAIIEKAVRGMLPHNKLGDKQFTKLKVYAGAAHPHSAQVPATFELPAHVSASA